MMAVGAYKSQALSIKEQMKALANGSLKLVWI
jgi:hypothetical protein